jgi:hypothetical protein
MEKIEPVEKKICLACGREKKITSFSRTSSGNRGNSCNLCKSLGNTINKGQRKSKEPLKNNPLQLGNVSIKDWVEMYKFLEKAGYSLEKDIHEQFCERYELQPKSPKQTFKNYYSQKDCGLI